MTKAQAMEIARGNIERHAEWDEEASPDTIYDEVWTLAFDVLVDQDCPSQLAAEVATELATCHAQP